MARTNLKASARPASVRTTQDLIPPLRDSVSPWIWAVVFGFLLTMTAVLVWPPLERISRDFDINYNEGWNAYVQQKIVDGVKIYGDAPSLIYTNYPPISFHVVGWLARLSHNVTLTGRWVSFLSLWAIAALAGMTVLRLNANRLAAVYSGLTFVAFVAVFRQDRIGMNDPHLLGMAFGAVGLYCLVRNPESALWLRLSAAAFSLSLFTKHSLVAFPAAVGVYLLLTSRKSFLTWIASAAAVSGVLLAFTLGADGAHFFEHMALSRTYSFALLTRNISWYLLFFQFVIVGALIWSFTDFRDPRYRLLAWSFWLANAFGMYFAGGAGADGNHLFDAVLALSLILGVVFPDAVSLAQKTRHRSLILVLALVLPFLGVVVGMASFQIPQGIVASYSNGQEEADFNSLVAFVKSRPGAALCENLLVCYEAGKPEVYDPFVVNELVRTNKLPLDSLLRLVSERRFGVVEINTNPNQPLSTGHVNFPDAFMEQLMQNYQQAGRTSKAVVLIPRT